MKQTFSLEQIWRRMALGESPLAESPVKVLQRIPCGDRADTFCLIGVNAVNQAFGYYEKRPKSLIIRTADKEQWYIWSPELVPHWPAIIKRLVPSQYSTYELTARLFKNKDAAEKSLTRSVLRLATEIPPIMLEVVE